VQVLMLLNFCTQLRGTRCFNITKVFGFEI
jgi:hypothetical protein